MSLKTEGEKWIDQLRLRWVLLGLLQLVLISLGLALLPWKIFSLHTGLFLLIWFLIFIVLLLVKPIWKIKSHDIASYLDANFAGLEESSTLFLKPEQELNLLEHLQIQKIQTQLPQSGSLNAAFKKLGIGLLFLVTCICLSILIGAGIGNLSGQGGAAAVAKHSQIKENIPSRIDAYELHISPPAYTRKPQRSQKQFAISAEAGAKVSWHLRSNVALSSFAIIFNDKEVHQLKAENEAATSWSFAKTIQQSGFYQLVLDGKKSDLYPIEMMADLPVKINIITPKQNSTIDVGQVPKTNLHLILTDDYGISDAFISATMASGKGEGVSFTEKKIALNARFNNQRDLQVHQTLDLRALGMNAGDELYFFINAKDNLGQWSRSDVYFVSITDPAELMSMASINNGVDLVPEYFRSQRQIIIDTEKLLKEQSTISVEEFKARSNALGMDQKLLRLRYGKFLGEVAETEVGGGHDDHDDDHAGGGEQKFGDVQAIMDEYAHKHDIAEDATFFEPELKAQLKAVLTEMWSSELQLRTYKPQDALPFEYKALRMLKELQQKSRVYVAKTTIKTTALKAEKRLSGILDKITSPKLHAEFEQKDQSVVELKQLLSILEDQKNGQALDENGRALLRNAEKHLIVAAADFPTIYLPALKSLRKLSTGSKTGATEISRIERAIQQLIGLNTVNPYQQSNMPATDLYQTYFNTLKKGSR